jgi:hypothetical protein
MPNIVTVMQAGGGTVSLDLNDPKAIEAYKASLAQPAPEKVPTVKLDLGCGTRKQEGFLGIDIRPFPGVDRMCDLRKTPWTLCPVATTDADVSGYALHGTRDPSDGKGMFWYGVPGGEVIPSDSVDEIYCSHMVEHLTWPERISFFNELGRIMKKGATGKIITPHWSSARYYGDPTHQSAFSEWAWFYMKKDWRKTEAPHVDGPPDGYTCDFDVTYGYSLAPWTVGRHPDFVNFAISAYKEACQDMIATLTKR